MGRDDTGVGLAAAADARQAAAEVMRKVEAGGDPVGEAEARRGALTLRDLFKQRLELDQDTAARTLDDYSKALELDVFSRIGDGPAVELTSDQIADVLERIERRSRHSAHRARCAVSSTFRWAQRKGKLRRNPVVGLGFTVRPIPRDRVFTDAEMRKLWHGIESAPELSPAMRIILQLALLIGLREKRGCRRARRRVAARRPVAAVDDQADPQRCGREGRRPDEAQAPRSHPAAHSGNGRLAQAGARTEPRQRIRVGSFPLRVRVNGPALDYDEVNNIVWDVRKGQHVAVVEYRFFYEH